jgi:hypothetical protein
MGGFVLKIDIRCKFGKLNERNPNNLSENHFII